MGIQSPKLSKFGILPINLLLRGDLFAQFYKILSVCTRLQVTFKFLVWSLSRDKHPCYKHFPAVGAFSLKFAIAPSGETKDRIKKSQGMQKLDGPPLSPCQVWWGLWVARGCRPKISVMFLSVCLSRFWNDEVCDNGSAMKQCNFQNNQMSHVLVDT